METAPDLPTKSIAIHDGIFHADEVFAIAAMQFLYKIDLIRTRDLDRLASADMRIDVGGKYCPETFDFDHHMAGFSVRHKAPNKRFEYGPKRSGFGLIFLTYGKDVIRAILKKVMPCTEPSNQDIDEIYEFVDYGLVATIDCIDNGEMQIFRLRESPYAQNSITKFIALLNPSQSSETVEEANSIQLEKFTFAVEIATVYLENEIRSAAEKIMAQQPFQKLVSEMTGDLLILDKYIPWFYAYSRAGELTNKIKMVVFPALGGSWMCQSPKFYYGRDKFSFSTRMSNGQAREHKYVAPNAICGLKDDELQKATGIKDAIFVHSNGHLGAATTKQGAIDLATFIIDNAQL